MGFVQRAAVAGKFQRFPGFELRAEFFQLPAALQHRLIAALRHQRGEIGQRRAIVRPVAQDVYAVSALIIIGCQLGRRDQMDPFLHRV